jgi:hypothetical protein
MKFSVLCVAAVSCRLSKRVLFVLELVGKGRKTHFGKCYLAFANDVNCNVLLVLFVVTMCFFSVRFSRLQFPSDHIGTERY